jgi:hypothetical protein
VLSQRTISAPSQARANQRVSASIATPRKVNSTPTRGSATKRLVGHEELDEERRAAEDEDEPFGGLAQGEVGRGLGQRKGHGEEEAERKRERGEIDVPDHAGADQDDLFADADVGLRQQPLADADGAERVGLEGFGAGQRSLLPEAARAPSVRMLARCP